MTLAVALARAVYAAGKRGSRDGRLREISTVARSPARAPAPAPGAAPGRRRRKARIPHPLRRQVFERDAYRCKHCGDWHDLCADHIVPESKGGPTTLANLQCLCRPCNSRKGVGGQPDAAGGGGAGGLYCAEQQRGPRTR